jgi:hypothetical protein
MGSKRVVPVSGGRRSEAQWRALVSAFAKSGLSRRAFCARQGVPVSTLDWWRKRLGVVPRAGASRAGSDALFVELSPPVSATSDTRDSVPAWDVELDLGAGVVLRVRRSAPGC